MVNNLFGGTSAILAWQMGEFESDSNLWKCAQRVPGPYEACPLNQLSRQDEKEIEAHL